MSLLKQIQADFLKARIQKNKPKVEALSFVSAQIKNAQIAKQAELNDNEIIKIIQKEVKNRQEAITIIRQANRPKLLESEKEKLSFLQNYLPQPLNEEELNKIVADVIAQNPEQKNNFGFLIKQVIQQTAGRADGAQIAQILKKTTA